METEATTQSFVEHFVNWALPVLAKAKKDEETEKAMMSHEEIGAMLAEKVPGFVRTENAIDPNEPGSAWKVDGDKSKEIGAIMRMKGYRPKGKSTWFRKPYQVDIGVSKGTTYVYITDDNTTPVKAKKEGKNG